MLKTKKIRNMQPPHQNRHSWVDLVVFKAQMVKKLGPQESKQYFYYLNRFLSLKLSKVEFNNVCLRIMGRENISLHNQLIRAILRNACTAKVVPPPIFTHYRQNRSQPGVSQALSLQELSNGNDVLHLSPRKARTGVRDPTTVNHCSTLGPNWKACFATQSNFDVPLENGDLHQQKMENGSDTVARMGQAELAGRDDKQGSPLQAPLGIQFRPGSIQRTSRRFTSTPDNVLVDSLTLKERMEQISTVQGLEGVSMDSTNILNRGLDCYIKGLIRSCIELTGARSRHNMVTYNTNMHPSCTKLINGVKPGHQYQTQNNRSFQVTEPKPQCPISFHEFQTAMELNPEKLGVDWPLLMAKIGTHAFDE